MRDRTKNTSRLGAIALAASVAFATPAAADKLLDEAVGFTGTVLFLQTGVPGLLLGVTRNGEKAVAGFGEISKGSGKTPDGDTLMRIGSVTKVFTGAVLASLAADGTVGLADPLADHLDWDVTVPETDGHVIRLIDLATHTSGLPREAEREFGPADDPFVTLTAELYAKQLAGNPLLYPPGTGALYSNFAFDTLAAALGAAAGKPYAELLAERVLDPVGLSDTVFTPGANVSDRLMQGHGFDGSPLSDVPATPVMAGASSLYSTTNDILKWLDWHLDRFSADDAEMRLLDHAAYVQRDGLNPVYGLDESGHMNAMSLGWVVMEPEGNRPLILQKAGGLQGMFVYTAFAPTRDIGAFVAINQFDFGAATLMAEVVNEMIADLAPR